MYLLLLTILYLAFSGMGLSASLLGSAWPVMQVEFTASLSTASIVSMIVSACIVLISLLADRILCRLGAGIVVVVGMVILAASVFGYAAAGSELSLYLLAVPFGIGSGLIESSINNYLANHYSSRHMSWLHCFWSLGSVISPFIMGAFLANNSNWRGGYLTIGFIQVALIVLLLATSFLWRVNGAGFFKVTGAGVKTNNAKPVSFRKLFKLKGIWFILFAFTAYCAFQRTAMLWASSYLVDVRGFAEDAAASYASMVFIGVTVGRFLGGFIADKLGDRRMIRYGIYLALFGAVLLLIPVQSELLAIVALIIIGLGAAPGFPSIVHAAPAEFGAANSQAVIGLEIAFANLGTTLMPPLFGFIADKTSLAVLPYYILFFALLMLILTEIFNRIRDKSKQC